MFLASSYGHLNVVQYLISKKANMNQADTNGKTALDLGTLKIYLILFLIQSIFK
jgi:ankyrin repeat protein